MECIKAWLGKTELSVHHPWLMKLVCRWDGCFTIVSDECLGIFCNLSKGRRFGRSTWQQATG